MSAPDAGRMVGRVLDPTTLPGGAVLVMKAARKAGGWFVWATRCEVHRPVKIVAAKEAPNGVAVFEPRPFERVLVKGRRGDGRRFVVAYLAGKVEAAYLLTRHHTATAPGALFTLSNTKDTTPAEEFSWRSEVPTYDATGITALKAYLVAEGPL